MKREIIAVKRRTGEKVRNIRVSGVGHILVPRHCFESEGDWNFGIVKRAVLEAEMLRQGKKLPSSSGTEDYGPFPVFEKVGSVYKENGQLYKEVDGEVEEVSSAQVAYWKAMASLNKTDSIIL